MFASHGETPFAVLIWTFPAEVSVLPVSSVTDEVPFQRTPSVTKFRYGSPLSGRPSKCARETTPPACGSDGVWLELPFPFPPSTNAPVRLVAEPGSALRSPETFPAGTSDAGKFPAKFASLVAGDIPAVCTYETMRFFPFVPAMVRSAPAAMREPASYEASAESEPKLPAPNPVALAITPSVPPGRPEAEIRNFSGLSLSFLKSGFPAV